VLHSFDDPIRKVVITEVDKHLIEYDVVDDGHMIDRTELLCEPTSQSAAPFHELSDAGSTKLA
jgi:hypothetical protein